MYKQHHNSERKQGQTVHITEQSGTNDVTVISDNYITVIRPTYLCDKKTEFYANLCSI